MLIWSGFFFPLQEKDSHLQKGGYFSYWDAVSINAHGMASDLS
jgi:hypothetical protein